MKKLLTILRHGEAVIGTPGMEDYNRNLSDKGREDIIKIAQKVKSRNTSFDCLIKSPAVRTMETASLMVQEINIPLIKIEQSMYESSLDSLLDVVRHIPLEVSNALLIGHNPSLSALISYLSLNEHINIPPGTMVRLEVFVGNWDHISRGSASLFEVIN